MNIAINTNDVDQLVQRALGPEHFNDEPLSPEASIETFKLKLPIKAISLDGDGEAVLSLYADGVIALAAELKRLAAKNGH